MDDDIELAIRREFLIEAAEILEKLESRFIDFEKSPNDIDLLAYIFRMFHTLKGSALTVGFDGLGKFAHAAESLLAAMRAGEINAGPQHTDLLLRTTDRLRAYIAVLENNYKGSIDTDDLVAELESMMRKPASAAAVSPTVPKVTASQTVSSPAAASTPSPVATHPTPVKPAVSTLSRPSPRSVLRAKSRILICDDEKDIVEILSEVMRGEGYDVFGCVTARDALELMAHEKVDLILSDLKMPDIDGVEFIRRAKGIDRNVQVIFVSGHAQKVHVIEFMKLGAFDFFEKPIDFSRLTVSVANGLRIKTIKDAVMALSSLNFKAYMTTSKYADLAVDVAHGHLPPSAKDFQLCRKKLEDQLDEISHLTNEIIST